MDTGIFVGDFHSANFINSRIFIDIIFGFIGTISRSSDFSVIEGIMDRSKSSVQRSSEELVETNPTTRVVGNVFFSLEVINHGVPYMVVRREVA